MRDWLIFGKANTQFLFVCMSIMNLPKFTAIRNYNCDEMSL